MRVMIRATFALLWTIAAISRVPAVAEATPTLQPQPSAELALATATCTPTLLRPIAAASP